MSKFDSESIKDFCEEALEIADQYGAQEGLSFLIGRKFFEVLRNLKEVQNKSKFLSPIKGNQNIPVAQGQAQTYEENIKRIENLEKIIRLFVKEIKDAFDVNDIEDYFASYPFLGEGKLPLSELEDSESLISLVDVLSEIRDIFYIEEMKNMLLGFEKDTAL